MVTIDIEYADERCAHVDTNSIYMSATATLTTKKTRAINEKIEQPRSTMFYQQKKKTYAGETFQWNQKNNSQN